MYRLVRLPLPPAAGNTATSSYLDASGTPTCAGPAATQPLTNWPAGSAGRRCQYVFFPAGSSAAEDVTFTMRDGTGACGTCGGGGYLLVCIVEWRGEGSVFAPDALLRGCVCGRGLCGGVCINRMALAHACKFGTCMTC